LKKSLFSQYVNNRLSNQCFQNNPIGKQEINLQFLNNVRNNIFIDPKTQGIVIMPRNEDVSVFTTIDEENVLLSYST